MLGYLALGFAVFGCSIVVARWFVERVCPQLAQAFTTFAAAFSAHGEHRPAAHRPARARDRHRPQPRSWRCARWCREPRGADPMRGSQRGRRRAWRPICSAMRLDHATGEVEGWVQARRRARAASSSSLGLSRAAGAAGGGAAGGPAVGSRCSRPISTGASPDWRRCRGDPPAAEHGMDERMALEILGLPRAPARRRSRPPTAS